MIDAWHPAALAAERAAESGESTARCLQLAAEAAQGGADATAEMRARYGRAAKLGDRVVGHVDPGAVSAALVLSEMAVVASHRV